MHLRPELRLPSNVPVPQEVSDDDATASVRAALAEERAALVAFARRRVGPRAEDVVQDAAVRALRKADHLASPAAARAWLFTIVRNLASQPVEGAQPASSTAPVDELGTPQAPADDGCDCVLSHLRALPENQRQLLERVVVDGASVGALATELGITPNNAWVRLHRARRALKERLASHCGTTSLRRCLDCGCVERGCCGAPAPAP